jgi:hypothetical protein
MALPGHGAAPTAVSGEAVLCLAPIQITAKKDPREARELREPKIHPPKQKRLSSPSPPAQPESGSISMAASSASSTVEIMLFFHFCSSIECLDNI